MFEKEIDYIKDILYSNGHKITIQRKNILLIFLENPEKHFSPLELHVKIKSKGFQIGFATIYRNIKILTENNIIEEIIHGDEKLYELKIFAKKSIHVHINCLKCNSITNFVNQNTSLKVIQQMNCLERDYSFILKRAEILITGICDKCCKGGESNSKTKEM